MPAQKIDASALTALARGQDDVVGRTQAHALGFSNAAIRLRVEQDGWSAPTRGALIIPPVRDPVRSLARAVHLSHSGTVCGVTAALYRDRERQDDLVDLGWRVRRCGSPVRRRRGGGGRGGP